jgi:predicted  nucleic acid-binding Zn-ribbon protein
MNKQEQQLNKLRDRVDRAKRDQIEYTARARAEAEHLRDKYQITIDTVEDAEREITRIEAEIDKLTKRATFLLRDAEEQIAGIEEKTNER